jgi:hypothetical protein
MENNKTPVVLDPLIIRLKRKIEQIKHYDSDLGKPKNLIKSNVSFAFDKNNYQYFFNISRQVFDHPEYKVKFVFNRNFSGGCSMSNKQHVCEDFDEVLEHLDTIFNEFEIDPKKENKNVNVKFTCPRRYFNYFYPIFF